MKKLLVLLLAVILVPYLWYRHALSAPGDAEDPKVRVTVESGASAQAISEELESEGAIRSAWAFRWYVKRAGAAADLKAGSYALSPSLSVPEVVDILTGKEKAGGQVTVTIPEGYTVQDIDALLAEKGLSEPGDVIDCANTCDFASFDFLPTASGLARRGGKLEGYLFPDTYFAVADGFVPKFFLERMLGTFRTKVIDAHEADIAASGRSLHEIVTMASLIEEETRKDDERAPVSGILWKRFDGGMGLGVDAAVRYIVDKPTAAITVGDLNVDSAYNLRKYRGLPPGPIANPGLKSIEAALDPQPTDFLYYLHGTDGQIRYAKTNDEHNANRARYIR